MQTLSLHNNEIGTAGGEAFANLMEGEASRPLMLEMLNLHGNAIGHDVQRRLREVEEVRVEGEQVSQNINLAEFKQSITSIICISPCRASAPQNPPI